MARTFFLEFMKKLFPATQTARLGEPSQKSLRIVSLAKALRKSPGILHIGEISERSRSSFDDVLRDDQSHYFRGPFADRVEPRISPVSMHIEFIRISIPSVYLNRLVADSQPVLARKDFRLGSLRLERFPLVLQI